MVNSAASEIIEKAFMEALTTHNHEDFKEGDLLDHWVLIGHVSNVDENDPTDGYPRFVSSGYIPNHVLRGLLHQALRDLDMEEFFGRLKAAGEDEND